MASGLEVRVLWDGATLEDWVYTGGRTLHIGAGAHVRTVAPGCGARVVRRGRGFALAIAAGVTIERPGEPPSTVGQLTERVLEPPFR
jgi:hypothetical protein